MNVTGDSLGQDLSSFNSCMIAAESKPTRDKVKELYNQKMEEYKERLRLETIRKEIDSYNEKLANKMVELARDQHPYSATSTENKYNKALGYPTNTDWCAIFVTWLAKETTIDTL